MAFINSCSANQFDKPLEASLLYQFLIFGQKVSTTTLFQG
jgi:hypothetical protein